MDPKVRAFFDEEPEKSPEDLALEKAQKAGFPFIDSPSVTIELDALEHLEDMSVAVPLAVKGGTLEIVVHDIPKASEFTSLQKAVGMPLALHITTKSIWESIQAHALSLKSQSKEQVAAAKESAIDKVLASIIELEASDLHLSVGSPPMMRLGGKLVPMENWSPLSASDLEAWVVFLIGKEEFDQVHNTPVDIDHAIDYAGFRWRISIYKQRQSFALAIRRLPAIPPTMEQLGLPAVLGTFCEAPSGLFIFAGPTGSGKSTSQAAMINRINERYAKHIITIENPIEYVHPNIKSLIHQREIGQDADTTSFATALRHVLRQDPDVILLGELRDYETISTAISAAETGHLVIATIHANSSAGVITRIIDSFPAEQQNQIRTQLATTLKGVITQALLPGAAGTHRRRLVSEILVVDNAIQNLIRDDKLHQINSAMLSNAKSGNKLWDRSLADAVRRNLITKQTAETHARDVRQLNEFIEMPAF